ncbi:NLP/P60 family protein [hydrothermal vent metagenome]|uniref:NLP/P60 family protein n=1 Tax=hydrothermal vent metagenome TaxID=652676 RepID=A0A1W1EFS6_9ZZZZ
MKSIFILSVVLFVTTLYAQNSKKVDCGIHIESVKNNVDTYTLVLKHDKNCEILMDHNESQISLISKIYEKDTKQVSDKNNSGSSSSKVEQIIGLAKSKMGDSYAPAKAGPEHFDCSGFVYYVFRQNNIEVPRTSLQQSKTAKKLKRSELKRGDILSFDTHNRNHINHSGIYLGNGKFIHSSSGKAYGVTISELDKGFYKDKFRWGVRKVD